METAFETSPTPYLEVFDGLTWLLLASSMIILAVFHTFEGAILGHHKLTTTGIVENFLRVLQSLLQEATKDRYSGTDRLLGGFWMLGTYVLMQYFGGDLKAHSVMQSPTLRISTADDLIKHRNTHKLMYPIETPVEYDLRHVKPSLRESMEVVLREGITLRVEDYLAPGSLRVMHEGRAVLSGEQYGLRFLMSLFCQTTDRLFYLSNEGFPKHLITVVMAQHLNKTLTDEISRRISIVFSMGVPFISSRELEPGGRNCFVTNSNSRLAFEALRFTDVSFSLASHLVFSSFCIGVFLAELAVFYGHRRVLRGRKWTMKFDSKRVYNEVGAVHESL